MCNWNDKKERRWPMAETEKKNWRNNAQIFVKFDEHYKHTDQYSLWLSVKKSSIKY